MRLARPPLWILLLLLQLPLILNPGYFSHDELQWWSRADVPSWSALPWISWLDVSPLQYRPLTFNLWLVLAHALAAMPWAMHLAFVLFGTANACLLRRVLVDARLNERVAYVAAIVFSPNPYAVYVHGWTGTLADLLTLACCLLAVRAIQEPHSPAQALPRAAIAALLVALALTAKESAIVLPALLALAAFGQSSTRTIRLAVAFSTAITVAYLALRLPALSNSAHASPAYAWSLRNAPARLLEYLLYPFTPPLFEIAPILEKSSLRLCAAGACVALLLASLATIGWRWPIAWLVAFAAALGPTLLLATSYDHYAYLASAAAIAIGAAAWPLIGRFPRWILLFLAAITIIHGTAVMSRVVAIGPIQRALYDDLLAQLASGPHTVSIQVEDPRDAWLLQRLLHDVDRYRGVSIADRVGVGDEMALTADRTLWMDRGGHLHEAKRSANAN